MIKVLTWTYLVKLLFPPGAVCGLPLFPLLHGPLMVTCAGDTVESFTARNLANTLWALAKMGHNPGDRLLGLLQAETLKKVAGFNPQNIANTLWAFANLGACLCASDAYPE